MASYYELQIETGERLKDEVSQLLGISSRDFTDSWNQIIEEDDPRFRYGLYYLIDFIESKIQILNEMGIDNESLSVWYMYEYVQQCNMEFMPEQMKKLGDLGITLCISCWEK